MYENNKNEALKIIIDNQVSNINQEEYKNQFSKFSGIWKGKDISQESVREEAWK